MKWTKSVLSASYVVVALLGCVVAAEDTIKIALSTALTGPVVQYGNMHRAGVQLAAEQINAQGGILGKKIEIVEMDDACNPEKASEVAHKVVSEQINFVLGPLCSGAVPQAAQIYNKHNIIMIASTASSDNLSTLGYSTFFRTIGKDAEQGLAAAAYITNTIKPKKLAIIHENQSYGQDLAAQVLEGIKTKGFKPVIFETFIKGDTDFSALIEKMKKADVDCVYYGGYHTELIILLRQANEQNFSARWMGPGGIASPSVIGDTAEGLLVTLPPDYSKEAENAEISAAFNAKQQDPTGSFVMTSYASVQVLADAINRTKTEDPVKVAEFMHNNTFKTVLGDISFTSQGDNAAAQFNVFVWHKDASKTLAPD